MKKSKHSAAPLVVLLVVSLLLGVGSCVAHVPVTVSADSPTNEASEPDTAGAEDLEYGSRLASCEGADGGAANANREGCDDTFSDSAAHPATGPRPKPPSAVR